MNFKLEICAANLASALAADRAEADRIELCSALDSGGFTPSAGLILEAKRLLKIPVFPLIRPREGDFCFSKKEVETMRLDVLFAKNADCEGVVIGALRPDGSLDLAALKTLCRAADGMEITFHRAFDFVKNPSVVLEQLIDLGVQRILTSGQRPTALEGKSLIFNLLQQAEGRIVVMAGSGVRPENLAELNRETGATEFHFSAKKKVESSFFLKKTELSGLDFDWSVSEEATIRAAKTELQQISNSIHF